MAISNFANAAAAVAGGYRQTDLDKGVGRVDRFQTTFDHPVAGGGSEGGFLQSAIGSDPTAQVTATANALAALNAQRKHRYGGAPGRPDGAANSQNARGGSHSDDVS